jgi:hypothetical protein
MIDQIKALLEELETRRNEVQPQIDDIETKRQEELAEVNKKYDHMVYDVKHGVNHLEEQIMNKMIDIFEEVVMNEFEAKRSISDYVLTDNIKDFRERISEIDMFPKELVERLDKIVDGEPIEKIAYDLEKIKNKYKI